MTVCGVVSFGQWELTAGKLRLGKVPDSRMLRRTGTLSSFVLRDLARFLPSGGSSAGVPGNFYQGLRHSSSGGVRFYKHGGFSRFGNARGRRLPLLLPKWLKPVVKVPSVHAFPYGTTTKQQKTPEGQKQTEDDKPDPKKGRPNTKKQPSPEPPSSTSGAETTSETQVKPAGKGIPAKDASTAKQKKRAKRKGTGTRTTVMDEYGYNYEAEEETFPITAYALCDEFDLKALRRGLIAQGLYIPTVLSDDLSDVIHVSAKYPIGDESREIFFFREGAVVFWNVSYLERVNVLKFLKEFQDESYDDEEIEDECEYMRYIHGDQGSTRLLRGKVILGDDPTNKILEKYAFANALASSVKLGIWESMLEKYVEGIEHITDALKRADEIKLSRAEVLQKTGELFALRHQLNLNSDLLDTPDFYWERERLETLYQKTCDYLSINRRTKVMNEKLTQCCELLDLIASHLTDQHHTRLEWMIIVLIMIEVGFEILHLLERYELIHI